MQRRGDLSGSQRRWIAAAGNIYDNDIEKIVNWDTKARVCDLYNV